MSKKKSPMYIFKRREKAKQFECITSQNSKLLYETSKTNIANVQLICDIISNGYTDANTLEFISEWYSDANNHISTNIRIYVLRSVASRTDLNLKTAFNLAYVNIRDVARALSETTEYEIVQKILLKRNPHDEIVVGKILRKMRNLQIVNRYIDSIDLDEPFAENKAINNSNYIFLGIYLNPNITEFELKKLISRKKIFPSHLAVHPNFTEEVFRHLLSSITFKDLNEEMVTAIMSTPHIKNYENVIKIIVVNPKLCSKKVLAAIMSNSSFPQRWIDFVINMYTSVIAKDKTMRGEALYRCSTEAQMMMIMEYAPELSGSDLSVVCTRLHHLRDIFFELISKKINRSEYATVKAYTEQVPAKYWHIYCRRLSNKNMQYILEKPDCPKEILTNATTSSCFSTIKAIINNPNLDFEIALRIYHNIKHENSMLFENRRQIWKMMSARFGYALLFSILDDGNTTDREMYCIFNLTLEEDVKCIIAKRIKGVYLQYVVNYVYHSKNSELYHSLLQNPHLSVKNRIFLASTINR